MLSNGRRLIDYCGQPKIHLRTFLNLLFLKMSALTLMEQTSRIVGVTYSILFFVFLMLVVSLFVFCFDILCIIFFLMFFLGINSNLGYLHTSHLLSEGRAFRTRLNLISCIL